MKISKSIFNFALRRNLEITLEESETASEGAVWIWEKDQESESSFILNNNADCLTWKGNVYLPESIKEELPATIFTETKLKEMLNFLSVELAKA